MKKPGLTRSASSADVIASLLEMWEVFTSEQTAGVQGLQTSKLNTVKGTGQMHRIPSIDRIYELKREIAALIKLNALYKADSRGNEVTLRANACRGLRLMEIREELGAMKRPNE